MSEADAPFILDLLNDSDFLRYIGDKGVRTLDDARRYIADGPLASYARFGFGLDVVCLKTGGTPVGICGLLKRDGLPEPDIGFAYREPYRRVGYGYEAANACLSHAREALALTRVLAITSPDNTPSIRLLEKLGFGFERLVSLAEGQPAVTLFARGMI
jgi:RimJ/RimL family protein N-acetyltransferase